MDDITIISYPGFKNRLLLSLTESRSKYMLPVGGKFRTVDFTIANSLSSGALRTIIYSDFDDDLPEYVEQYGPFAEMNFPPIKVVSRNYTDIKLCYSLIMDSNTSYYIIYKGDNPSIIDFRRLLNRYRKTGNSTVLYKLKFGEQASLAHTVLVTTQKDLLEQVNRAMDENRESPNIFEMLINMLLNQNIPVETFTAHYWLFNNVPDYYDFTMNILRDMELFDLLFKKSELKSMIRTEGYAKIGPAAKISSSFISDGCEINGTVVSSVIYPGVRIEEGASVKNSVILPYAVIGRGAGIVNSIVDEGRNTPDGPPGIGANCRIGSTEEHMRNGDHPKSLFNSITLIAKDCEIPESSIIGGACHVTPGPAREFFAEKKQLPDASNL